MHFLLSSNATLISVAAMVAELYGNTIIPGSVDL